MSFVLEMAEAATQKRPELMCPTFNNTELAEEYCTNKNGEFKMWGAFEDGQASIGPYYCDILEEEDCYGYVGIVNDSLSSFIVKEEDLCKENIDIRANYIPQDLTCSALHATALRRYESRKAHLCQVF
jgi:hypothetical protein